MNKYCILIIQTLSRIFPNHKIRMLIKKKINLILLVKVIKPRNYFKCPDSIDLLHILFERVTMFSSSFASPSSGSLFLPSSRNFALLFLTPRDQNSKGEMFARHGSGLFLENPST